MLDNFFENWPWWARFKAKRLARIITGNLIAYDTKISMIELHFWINSLWSYKPGAVQRGFQNYLSCYYGIDNKPPTLRDLHFAISFNL